MKPSIGRIVHYVSFGTPVRADGSQAFTSQCRAAIITGLCEEEFDNDPDERDCVHLAVLNPKGLFLDEHVTFDEDGIGGTWHWPERVED